MKAPHLTVSEAALLSGRPNYNRNALAVAIQRALWGDA